MLQDDSWEELNLINEKELCDFMSMVQCTVHSAIAPSLSHVLAISGCGDIEKTS